MKSKLTKRKLIELTGIGLTKYNEELERIKSSSKYSGLTMMQGQTRIFDPSILNHFFCLKIKPRDHSNSKKFRSFIKSKKFNFIGHLSLGYKLDDARKTGEYFKKILLDKYGKKGIEFYFWLEPDLKLDSKNTYHLHFVCRFDGSVPSLDVFKSHFNELLEERVGKSKRIEINNYYGEDDKTGIRYVMKMGLN